MMGNGQQDFGKTASQLWWWVLASGAMAMTWSVLSAFAPHGHAGPPMIPADQLVSVPGAAGSLYDLAARDFPTVNVPDGWHLDGCYYLISQPLGCH